MFMFFFPVSLLFPLCEKTDLLGTTNPSFFDVQLLPYANWHHVKLFASYIVHITVDVNARICLSFVESCTSKRRCILFCGVARENKSQHVLNVMPKKVRWFDSNVMRGWILKLLYTLTETNN